MEFFWYCKEYTLEHEWERVVPSTQAQLLVNLDADTLRWRTLDGRTHLSSGAAFSSASWRPKDIDTPQQYNIMGVLFRPGEAAAVCPHPANVSVDLHLELEQLWPDGKNLRERLTCVENELERFLILEAYLLPVFQVPAGVLCGRDPIPAALNLLQGGATVRETADHLGYTYKSLNRLFKERVGTSPKQTFRLLRFRRALENLDRAPGKGWSEFALAHGYADQSHLIREFQTFSTFSPGELATLGGNISGHIPLEQRTKSSIHSKPRSPTLFLGKER